MKTILAGLVLAALCSANSFSQDADIVAPPPPKTPTVDTNVLSRPRPVPPDAQKRRVKKSGALAGWKKGDKPHKVLSLRKPAHPERDGENVINDLPTETRRGIKLFSFDF